MQSERSNKRHLGRAAAKELSLIIIHSLSYRKESAERAYLVCD